MECNNCYASNMWNLINPHLFENLDFFNIKMWKENDNFGIENVVYQSNCNHCKKTITVKEQIYIIDKERENYILNKLNQYLVTSD